MEEAVKLQFRIVDCMARKFQHGRFAADDRNAGAVGSNDVAHKAVGFGTDGIVREADGVVRLHDEILFFFLQGLCGFDAVFFRRREVHCHAESGRGDPTNALVVLRIVREASKKMREGSTDVRFACGEGVCKIKKEGGPQCEPPSRKVSLKEEASFRTLASGEEDYLALARAS